MKMPKPIKDAKERINIRKSILYLMLPRPYFEFPPIPSYPQPILRCFLEIFNYFSGAIPKYGVLE
jgi:hypothetical protein